MSVLVPIYNSPDLLATIGSVLCQTYERIELVLADDASRQFDQAAVNSFIQTHRKSNLESCIILASKQNTGTVATLKRALDKSSGSFIITLAGDDLLYDADVIRDWIGEFTRTGADLITGRCENYDEEFKSHTGVFPSAHVRRILNQSGGRELFEHFAMECLIPGASTAWRTDRLKYLGGFDLPYRLIEDYPLYLRHLRQGGTIHFFDRAVVKHRGGGVSSEGNYISEQFEEDSEAIFQQEILPYTTFPARTARKHNSWRNDVRFDRRYQALCKKHGSHRLILFALQLVYYIYHPVRAFRAVIHIFIR